MTGIVPPRVCVESPFAGDVALNVLYADACMFDALVRGEAPYLNHLQYPRVLDDEQPDLRVRGLAAHHAWLRAADLVAFYTDRAMSGGMVEALKLCVELSLPYEFRRLGEDWQHCIAAVRGTPDFFLRHVPAGLLVPGLERSPKR